MAELEIVFWNWWVLALVLLVVELLAPGFFLSVDGGIRLCNRLPVVADTCHGHEIAGIDFFRYCLLRPLPYGSFTAKNTRSQQTIRC